MRIAVISASTDAGREVVRRLCERGHDVIATSRDPARLTGLDTRARTAVFDIADPASPATFLDSVDRVVSLAHASTVTALVTRIPATCQRLVVTGSTMRDSQVPDPRAEAVRRNEAAFRASGLPGSMLHPTMIYGSRNEANVVRVLRLVDRWPRWLPLVWPVPDGGRHRVQPVYVDDVAAALAARTIRTLTGRSPFSVDELRRTREDKAYDIAPLRRQLGIEPVAFAEGLRRGYRRHQYSVEAHPARE